MSLGQPKSLRRSSDEVSSHLAHTTWKTSGIFLGGHRDDTRGVPRSSTECIVIEIPGRFPWTSPGRRKRASSAHNFRPSGFDDRGTSPSSVVIPRLKASFNIYDLFRFNSTRKLEAYLYSSGWLARRRARRQSDFNPLRPDLGSKFGVSLRDSRRKCSPSSPLNITFYSILNALQAFAAL